MTTHVLRKKGTRTTTTRSRLKKRRSASASRRRRSTTNHTKLRGGSLPVELLHQLLEESYKDFSAWRLDTKSGVYVLDTHLSSKLTKVYHNPKTQHTIVAHRGTFNTGDWGNNFAYCIAGKAGYECTNRYEDAKRVQRLAEQKYGVERLTTVGHSQGGLLAEILGKNGLEIITYNRPVRVGSNDENPFQFNIRHAGDVVSRGVISTSVSRDLTLRAPSESIVSNHGLSMLRYGYDEPSVGRPVPPPPQSTPTSRNLFKSSGADAQSGRPISSVTAPVMMQQRLSGWWQRREPPSVSGSEYQLMGN